MTRTPLQLAALASAAVPGLDPVGVRGMTPADGHDFDVAVVTDSQDRRWVVRAPANPAAGAHLDQAMALTALLARRLPFGVPVAKGFVAVTEGRALVYPWVPGQPLDLALLGDGPLAAELGRALAALHNVEMAVIEEAGLASYDAAAERTRRLRDLDRGAATKQVPAELLARWERQLEEPGLWQFAPTAVHGDLDGRHVLVEMPEASDEGLAAGVGGKVRGITGWEKARFGDPAEDFAPLVAAVPEEVMQTTVEAYAEARVTTPDAGLLRRARLLGELRLLGRLLAAASAADTPATRVAAARLGGLAERIAAEDAAVEARRAAESDAEAQRERERALAQARRDEQERALAHAQAQARAREEQQRSSTDEERDAQGTPGDTSARPSPADDPDATQVIETSRGSRAADRSTTGRDEFTGDDRSTAGRDELTGDETTEIPLHELPSTAAAKPRSSGSQSGT